MEERSYILVNGSERVEMGSQELSATIFELVTKNETTTFQLVERPDVTFVVVTQ